ncbi:MAG: YihY/virulence factor BrkB family protein, partial [Gluconacetobacter diazotrophicus]|nr:YihY/virulence factor BrkB family protein [Gluconacetobacter diazotrophicus]
MPDHPLSRELRPALPVLLVLLLLGLVLPRRPDGAAGPGGAPSVRPPGAPPAGHSVAAHSATAPEPAPVTGPWSFLLRAWAVFSEDRVMSEAASVTFYVLLSLFPGLASIISIYGLFGDPAELSRQLHAFGPMIPGGGMQILDAQIQALAKSSGGALGVGVIIGLLTSLWSSNNGIKSLFEALNVVFREKEERSFVRFTLTAFA